MEPNYGAGDALMNGTDLTAHADGQSDSSGGMTPEQWARVWVGVSIAALWFLGGIVFKGRN
jgi:hypothetical protein